MKKGKIEFVIFTFFSLLFKTNSLLSVSENSSQQAQMLAAYRYFEAEDFEKADQIYQNLWLQQNEPWKRDILDYNRANILLAAGDYQPAIEAYNKISLGKAVSPLIVRRIKSNIAVSRWRLTTETIDEIKEQKKFSEHLYNNAFSQLRLLQRDIRSAEAAECELKLLEGAKECTTGFDLEQLKQQSRIRLALLNKDYIESKTSQIGIKKGLNELVIGLYIIINDLNELSITPYEKTTLKEQVSRIGVQTKSWDALWQSVQNKMRLGKTSSDFNKAYNLFKQALEIVDSSDITQIKKYLEESMNLLDSVLTQLIGKDPLKKNLQLLMSGYEKALATFPFQESTLIALKAAQKRVIEALKVKDLHYPLLDKSVADLEKSVELTHSGDHKGARIYLMSARQQAQRVLWDDDIEVITSPQVSLERLIEEQKYAYTINILVQEMPAESNSTFKEMLLEAQQQVLQKAPEFIQNALTSQDKDFHGDVTEEDPYRCQNQPWAETFPLFDKGLQEAKSAEQLLSKKTSLKDVEVSEVKVLTYWNDALKSLQKKRTSDSCQGSEQKAPQPSDGNEQQKTKNQQTKSNEANLKIDQVLRLLQKMQQDDHTNKVDVPVSGSNKPW
jgi:tetratricopeptide (TPR) repeat protein